MLSAPFLHQHQRALPLSGIVLQTGESKESLSLLSFAAASLQIPTPYMDLGPLSTAKRAALVQTMRLNHREIAVCLLF